MFNEHRFLYIMMLVLSLLMIMNVASASDIDQQVTDDTVLSTDTVDVTESLSVNENTNDNLTDGYVDVSEAYDCLNEFRTEDNVWQWNADNTTKTYFNTNDSNKLEPLAWDTALEQTAKVRAKELVEKFDHERPDGTKYSTAFPDGYTALGENIAWGYPTGESVTEAWKETNDMYEKQGHRRNMLNSMFNCVGIAGYEKDGIVYWVQNFGYNKNIVYNESVRPSPNTPTTENKNELYVNSSVTTNGNGSKTNPFKDLKSAINKAENGYTIYVAPGTYTGLNNTNLTIYKSLYITNWTKGDVIFDGKQENRIFHVGYSEFNISGLIFKNGESDIGGAIIDDYGNCYVVNCSFINNTARYWGVLFLTTQVIVML